MTAGTPSLTQGAYATRGNLELVVPDAIDGIWVFWYNSDALGAAHDRVRPGTWSEGLQFGRGDRWTDVWIVQSALGPDHLEALALRQDGTVVSWCWSPEHGFRTRAGAIRTQATAIALAHEDGALLVSVRDARGLHHLRAGVDGYPDRRWLPTAEGPELRDPDAPARLAASGVELGDVDLSTVRSAPSTRDGGTTEFTWRDALGRIHHLGVPDTTAD